MTEPINLAALRMQTDITAATGQIATLPENLPDGHLADYLATIPARDLLALIDVAEAARKVIDEDGNCLVCNEYLHDLTLRDALARFDFGNPWTTRVF